MNPLEALAAALRRAAAVPPRASGLTPAVRAAVARVPPPRAGSRVHILVTATDRRVNVHVAGPASPAYRAQIARALYSQQVREAAGKLGRDALEGR